jgi:hypothetical protein
MHDEDLRRIGNREWELLRRATPVCSSLQFEDEQTSVFDEKGTLLFHRVPVHGTAGETGFVDLGINPDLGGILLAVELGTNWDEEKIFQKAESVAERSLECFVFEAFRFVAFSYPKVGVQFLENGIEVALVEWPTWRLIPPISVDQSGNQLYSERWSLVASIPDAVKHHNQDRYAEALGLLDLMPGLLIEEPESVKSTDSRSIQYSHIRPNHSCFELRTQEDGNFCVPASMAMVLEFYRYKFSQKRLARELGLIEIAPGPTSGATHALSFGETYLIVKALSRLTCGALIGGLNISNDRDFWEGLRREIRGNRPVILTTPGHAEVVTGYSVGIEDKSRWVRVHDPAKKVTSDHQNECGWRRFLGQQVLAMVTARLRQA